MQSPVRKRLCALSRPSLPRAELASHPGHGHGHDRRTESPPVAPRPPDPTACPHRCGPGSRVLRDPLLLPAVSLCTALPAGDRARAPARRQGGRARLSAPPPISHPPSPASPACLSPCSASHSACIGALGPCDTLPGRCHCHHLQVRRGGSERLRSCSSVTQHRLCAPAGARTHTGSRGSKPPASYTLSLCPACSEQEAGIQLACGTGKQELRIQVPDCLPSSVLVPAADATAEASARPHLHLPGDVHRVEQPGGSEPTPVARAPWRPQEGRLRTERPTPWPPLEWQWQ